MFACHHRREAGGAALRPCPVLAQAEGSRDAEATRHLDPADRLAPQRIRNDPKARELVLTLTCRARHRVWELDSLRNRFGIG